MEEAPVTRSMGRFAFGVDASRLILEVLEHPFDQGRLEASSMV